MFWTSCLFFVAKTKKLKIKYNYGQKSIIAEFVYKQNAVWYNILKCNYKLRKEIGYD